MIPFRLQMIALSVLLATASHAASPDPATSRKQPAAVQKANPKSMPMKGTAVGAKPLPAPIPQDDQSYLFATDPRSGKGPPDYVTSGSKHSNQPWFMTIYDTTGWN